MRNAISFVASIAATLAFCSPVPARELTGTLLKAKQTGAFTIGYRESSIPLSYLGTDAAPVGFSVDLCRAVAEAVKKRVGKPDLQIKFSPVNSSNRMPLVENGTVDIECGSTVNYTIRQKQVAFSLTTFPVQKVILTKTSSGIKNLDDLKGRTLAITQGTDTLRLFTRLNSERHMDLTIVQGKDHAESVFLVDTGRAAAFVDDSVLLASFRAGARNPSEWVVVPGLPEIDPYALMFRRDDPEFKALVDATLLDLMKTGTFAKIYSTWFEHPIQPKGINLEAPMPEAMKALIAKPSDNARE